MEITDIILVGHQHWWITPRDYNMEGRKSIPFIEPLTSAQPSTVEERG
jgi:hypothetical protein